MLCILKTIYILAEIINQKLFIMDFIKNILDNQPTQSVEPINNIQLDKQMQISDLLSDTGTAWNVLDLPLVASLNHEHGNELLGTTSRGLFRSDNHENLGVVGSRYSVLQNSVLAETMVDLHSQFGGKLNGGTLKEGAKVFYQLSLPDMNIGNYENNGIKRNVTALNSHDGTTSIGFGTTNVVVNCSNTFHMALKNVETFRHTASASERLQFAIKSFEEVMKTEQGIMDNFNAMNDRETNQDIVQKVILNMFGKEPSKNKVNAFASAYATEYNTKGKENNAWVLFNAVTRYTNHIAKKNDLNYVMQGEGYKKNKNAYDMIVKWIHEPTKTMVAV